MCTKSQAIDILAEVYNAGTLMFKDELKDVFLYGSYARGDYHTQSDVDILITVDMSEDNIALYRRHIASVASELSLRYDVTVSVTVKSIEQFRRYADILPYYKNVIKEGIRYAV